MSWVLEQRRSLLRRSPWLEVFQDTLRLPDGRLVEDFYSIDLPDYAVVAALTDNGDVLAETQYRPGIGRDSWTLPAGFLEPGEEPLAAARRELLEETGFGGGEWAWLGSFTVDGNRGCGGAHFFLAEGVRRTAEVTALDLVEVDIHVVPFAALIERLNRGDVCELATATGLGLAALQLAGRGSPRAHTAS